MEAATITDPHTGEIRAVPQAPLAPADAPSRYALLRDEAEALRLRIEERLESLAGSDAELEGLRARQAQVAAERAQVEDGWREAFEGRPPGHLDFGRVRVTKPKPPVSYNLGRSAKELAQDAAADELGLVLSGVLEQVLDLSDVPEAMLEAAADAMSAATIAWLDPRAVTGKQQDLRFMVRSLS